MENYLELLRKELKNILSDLMQNADNIVDNAANNHCVETQIHINLSCEELPTYTISTKRLSSRIMESVNEKDEKYES